jgi:glycosyltransferase involved in cell wall biosynthesis
MRLAVAKNIIAMNILFKTSRWTAPSTVLNLPNFQLLGECDGVTFSTSTGFLAGADVVLFMGYDPEIEAARNQSPGALVGVIDPRPDTLDMAATADFIIVNGPEMGVMALSAGVPSFVYPIYRSVPKRPDEPDASREIVLCYHGNLLHAMSMAPVITGAIDRVGERMAEKGLGLRVQYICGEAYGGIPARVLPKRVPATYIPWHNNVYAEELSQAHIGLVPNFVPLRRAALLERITRNAGGGATKFDWLSRYKPTSNPGRILSFAVHGIPVISDIFPSAAMVIEHGESGFLVRDTESWENALFLLCTDERLRHEMGENLHRMVCERYRPLVLNQKLLHFIRRLRDVKENARKSPKHVN